MSIKNLLFLSITVLFSSSLFANQGVKGVWLTAKKGAKIEIYQCGNEICGKVVWLEEPNDENGKPLTDLENPDEAKQNDPILGLNLLKGFEKTEDNVWEDGTVYDPNSGKTYKCKLTLESEDKLEVRGFIGFSLLGKTEVWTRSKL